MQTLSPGTQLLHYRITSVLGVGGMGEVYKALDTSLERPVALKILSQDFVQSPESLGRFVQEARAASALNHPNIVTVHEVGTTDVPVGAPEEGTVRRVHYISMEFIDGETLRSVLEGDKVSFRDKVALLAQVAEGLAKAHREGIVHRDLKPDNIMITSDGYAKILDFGLAKLIDRQKPFTASAARNLTNAGAVVGTLGYMSPEQVEGKPVDHRADVFAFGCILYQAATGRGPFETDSIVDTLHRIVHSEPEPVKRYSEVAPPDLVYVIERCLRKKPEDRWQSMSDVATELERIAATMAPGSRVGWARARRWLWAAGGLAIAALAVAGWIAWQRRIPRSFDTMRITAIPGAGRATTAAISPDGRYLVYAVDDRGRQQLVVRQLAADSDIRLVPTADVHFVGCAFSEDGEFIYYVSADNRTDRGSLYRIATLGGVPRLLAGDIHARISVSPDGRSIVYATVDRTRGTSSIYIRQLDSGAQRVLATRRLPDAFSAVNWTPDGRAITYSTGTFAGGFHTTLGQIEAEDKTERRLESPRWRTIDSLAWLPRTAALILIGRQQAESARNQVWMLARRGGTLRRVTNDLSDYETVSITAKGNRIATLQKTTAATLWSIGVDEAFPREAASSRGTVDGIFGLSVTRDGATVYSSDTGDSRDLWLSEPNKPPQRITDGKSDVYPAVSPDGKTVVFVSLRSGRSNLWTLDLVTRAVTQLTTGNFETSPAFSADGRSVYYHTNRSGVRTIWRVPVAGGTPVQVTKTASSWPVPSPDGKWLACSWFDKPSGRAKIAILPAGGGSPVRLLDIPVNFWLGGGNNHVIRWRGNTVTYVATDGEGSNIWALPADGSGAPVRLTRFPRDQIFFFDWMPDGKQVVVSRGAVNSNVVTIDAF